MNTERNMKANIKNSLAVASDMYTNGKFPVPVCEEMESLNLSAH